MNQLDAIRTLKTWAKQGRWVLTKHDLAKLFSGDQPKTFAAGLNRLVKAAILVRACRGIYVNKEAAEEDIFIIERIAKALRPGEYSYISLESMLSEYDLISQIPIDRLTVMTTGRKGLYQTPYGTIEMTHTKRSIADILKNTRAIKNKPLRIATKKAAMRDLKRVGRNVDLIEGADHE